MRQKIFLKVIKNFLLILSDEKMSEVFCFNPKFVGLSVNSIWEAFIQMTQQGKTVIITTNYIQEARHAHTVCI